MDPARKFGKDCMKEKNHHWWIKRGKIKGCLYFINSLVQMQRVISVWAVAIFIKPTWVLIKCYRRLILNMWHLVTSERSTVEVPNPRSHLWCEVSGVDSLRKWYFRLRRQFASYTNKARGLGVLQGEGRAGDNTWLHEFVTTLNLCKMSLARNAKLS